MPRDTPARLALRPAELAKALGVDERTLRRWQRNEGFPFVRVGQVVMHPVEEVRIWLAERVEGSYRADTLADEILRDL